MARTPGTSVGTLDDETVSHRLGPLKPEQRLVDRVSAHLLRGIVAGRVPQGGKLNETEIAGDLGISRIPLREALSMLETQGIVIADPRRGRRVVLFDDIKVEQICRSRLALERLAVQEAARTYALDPARIARLDEVIDRMDKALDGSVDRFQINQNDIDFHTEVYAATDNFFLQILWETLSRHTAIVFALETFHRVEPERNLRQHRHLRDLLLKGEETALDAEIERHILSHMMENNLASHGLDTQRAAGPCATQQEK